MQSIWQQQTQIAPRPALPGDMETETVVIGAGMAGVLTARLLTERGVACVVLEAERIGQGQTAHTTAKITAQHGLCYAALLQDVGLEKTRQYADENLRAIDAYERLVRELNISCGFERLSACLYTAGEPTAVQREAAVYGQLGLPGELRRTAPLPFETTAALYLPGQAQFQPLAFLNAVSAGLEIYEQTQALGLEGTDVLTDRGRIHARQVVVATHFPFINAPGYYFARMHQERSYVLALRGAAPVDAMYYGVDTDEPSLRRAGEYLLFGGQSHRTGENRTGGQYAALERAALLHYPGAQAVQRWSAQDCMTLDGLPYIGPYAGDKLPGVYVATGFGKWGMTGSMLAAQVLCDLLTGRDNPAAHVVDPGRSVLSASAAKLWEEAKHAVSGLAAGALAGGRDLAANLPLGHGGIVEVDGQKVGVYRDEDGKLYVVPARCPHMGCQLEWNPDEHSWDCPCHGSRFTYTGALIGGPAMGGLRE